MNLTKQGLATHKTIPRRQLRSFGLIVAGGFALIAVAPIVFRGGAMRTWALTLAVLLSTTGLIVPNLLRPVYRVWMTVGEALGWLNSRIILTAVYYGLMFPIGAILRAGGNDPMRRKLDPKAATYRIQRVKRPASHMHHQY